MLAGLRLADPQLRMLAAAPMDRQDDLTLRLVDVGDDVGHQSAQEPLRPRILTLGALQAALRSSASPVKSGMSAVGAGIRIASSRASHAATRRSAASQLFSSCAVINRLSGSQAA